MKERPPYGSVADLDARVRSLDHLSQLAALAASEGGAAADGGDFIHPQQTQVPRARKGHNMPGARPGFERLAQRAAALTAAAGELAGVEAAALAWEGVKDVATAQLTDAAATARGAARLREARNLFLSHIYFF